MAKSIMIQGAGSNVGKSMVVAGLCRAYSKRGLNVAPFKPQNMSNNAAVTSDGGEIGRAQALQAMACGLDAHTDMNPVLLKPETDIGAQVIVQGQRLTTAKAREYGALKQTLMPRVLESFERLKAKTDIVIVEGAGSPAEINLRAGDIANMGFASAAHVPVVLLGDIDRGGVIAQMVGTHAILPKDDLALIKGFAINKFRGDTSLFDAGLNEIVARTGWQSLGVLPWFGEAHKLPAEDASDISNTTGQGAFKIAVPQLSRIANFDDLDPLSAEPDVVVEIIPAGRPLPNDADLILIPGSKSTIGDLQFFRDQGWDIDLSAHIRCGGRVLGICGGYQMLGREIIDDLGIEGNAGRYAGLGHLDITTHMKPEKKLSRVIGADLQTGASFDGYEIHIGDTDGSDCKNAWLQVDGNRVGASNANGRVQGCYIHGLFNSDAFRAAYLSRLGVAQSGLNYGADVDATLDRLAAHVEHHLDLDAIAAIAE
ncbi:cobyric acid synthase CobQ [Amylibacter kogurei]|uniref:Cobyric acid synthase n=1 Tax=Paramylibacter kogurei TaxID=1889778 RepID=A0A2G5K307_9RHOB|nr:cobyric acid synthase [Amylibacter kogurei]PIB23499.1 cobyric acid synthase CobQ [Amylibacter kogurei]